jgi:Flp pilus assembly protein TadD
MWIERAARVGLIAASQFIEIKVSECQKKPVQLKCDTVCVHLVKEFTAATALLEPLATQRQQSSSSTNSELRSALGRVYLQAGQLDRAEAHFTAIATADAGAGADAPESTKALNAAFLASARGDWDAAGTLLRGLVEQDDANYAVRCVVVRRRGGAGGRECVVHAR